MSGGAFTMKGQTPSLSRGAFVPEDEPTDVEAPALPEPATAVLGLMGLAAVAARRRG